MRYLIIIIMLPVLALTQIQHLDTVYLVTGYIGTGNILGIGVNVLEFEEIFDTGIIKKHSIPKSIIFKLVSRNGKILLLNPHLEREFNKNHSLRYPELLVETATDSIIRTVDSTATDNQLPESYFTPEQGILDGREFAKMYATENWRKKGLGAGIFTGLIGTAIISAASQSSGTQIPPEVYAILVEKPEGYRMGFMTGYDQAMKKKKFDSALSGGIVGTLIIVALLVIANNQQ